MAAGSESHIIKEFAPVNSALCADTCCNSHLYTVIFSSAESSVGSFFQIYESFIKTGLLHRHFILPGSSPIFILQYLHTIFISLLQTLRRSLPLSPHAPALPGIFSDSPAYAPSRSPSFLPQSRQHPVQPQKRLSVGLHGLGQDRRARSFSP